MFQPLKPSPMYSVDFNKLRDQNLPKIMQTPILQAFISVLQSSVVRMHAEFLAFKTEKDIRLSHDARVISLESLLNDLFDSTERRITVIDANLIDDLRVGSRTSIKVTRIGTSESVNTTYVRNSPRYYTTDFIVQVPVEYAALEIIIYNLVSGYKLAGKTFEISLI